MSIKEIQELFPSQDGNEEKRRYILGNISKLMEQIDNLKDENSPMLKGMEEKTGDFYNKLITESEMPFKGVKMNELLDKMKDLAKGHPYANQYSLNNVTSLANIPSFMGNLTALLLDGNTVWDVVGPANAEAEVRIVSMMSKIIGYDAEKSGGYTTWGGQGTVFTGLRLAIAKHCPTANKKGVPRNFYCFSSEGSHYSLLKSIEATGIGSDNLVKIKTKEDLSMDIFDLKEKMENVIKGGGIPIYVVATMGTTDSFAIDDLQSIRNVVDTLAEKYNIKPAHIHADSAIGAMYSLFNDYNFNENPLKLNSEVLEGLYKIHNKIKHLDLADSLCFDFHKLGSTPYVSTLLLIKNGVDFKLVDLDESDTPYVGNRGYGSYHTSYTLECSRMGSAITIYASLIGMGIENYQRILSHYIEVNIAFRKKLLERIENVAITNELNLGCITNFRFYPHKVMWDKEKQGLATSKEVMAVNAYNKEIFEIFGANRKEIFLGDTTKICLVKVSDSEELFPIYAVKFVSLSPYTEIDKLDKVIDFIEKYIRQI